MSLVAWYPLNGDLENYVASGVELINKGATISDNGKIGKCYYFDGTDDRIYNKFSLENKIFSTTLWFKANRLTSNAQYLISLSNGEGSAAQQLAFIIYNNGVTIHAGGKYQKIEYNFNLDEWYHLGLTSDGVTQTLYINGNNQGNYSVGTVKGSNLTIGARSVNSSGAGSEATYFFKGYINDLRIYDHCLSPAEVKKISQGLVLHYTMDNLYGNENLIKTDNLFKSYSSSTITVNKNTNGGNVTTKAHDKDTYLFIYISEPLVDNEYYTLSFDCSKIDKDSNISWSIDNKPSIAEVYLHTGRNKMTFQCTSTIGNKTTHILFGDIKRVWGENQENYTLSNFKLERGEINTSYCPNTTDQLAKEYGLDKIYDSSGYKNDGTSLNVSSIIDCIRGKGAIELNGDGYVTNNSYELINTLNSGTFTISLWAKPTQLISSEWKMLFMCRTPKTTVGDTQFMLAIKSDGIILAYFSDDHSFSYNFDTEKWYHITVSSNNNIASIFVNGILVGKAYKSQLSISNNAVPTIGADSDRSARYFNGCLDDIRFYSTALSDSDILQLYKETQKIDDGGNVYCSELNENIREIEYLESTGTQYIDTGIAPTSTTRFYIEASTQGVKEHTGLFGCRTNGGKPTLAYIENSYASETNIIRVDVGNMGGCSTGVKWIKNEKFSIDINYKEKKVYVNNILVEKYNSMIVGDLGSVTIGLFANHDSERWLFPIAGRIYKCQIWQNGALVRDFVPTISYESGHEGEPCLFDLVENKYYYNQGTGKFLTNEYEDISFIRSTGAGKTDSGQHIDTGYYLTQGKSFGLEMEFTPIRVPKQEIEYLAVYGGGINFQIGHGIGGWMSTVTSNCDVTPSSTKPLEGVRYNVKTKSLTQYTPTTTSTRSLFLFSQNEGNSKWDSAIKLYFCKLYEDGELIKHFVPYISTETGHEHEPCLLDLIENKCYYNQGVGNFEVSDFVDTRFTNKGLINNAYIIEGNSMAKIKKNENIIEVNNLYEN